jgi:peptidoglycan/LPS O-acetylase OafA/YrhL
MKLDQLTFTRFLAAISIVIFHAQSNVYPFNLPFLHSIFGQANVGVSYFFILSGFVMIIAYGKDKSIKISPKEYYLNRVARIYPVYFVAFMLAVLTCLKSDEMSFKNFLLQLFAIQAWLPDTVLKLNTPAWSLSVEALFYLIFPFLFNYFYRKYSYKTVFLITICIWVITQAGVNYLFFSPFYKGFPSNSHNFLFYFPLLHLNEFMIGNITGYAFFKLNNSRKKLDFAVIAVFVMLLIALYLNISLLYNDGFMAIIFAPLILLMALNTGKMSKLFSHKYLITLGEASYGIYILQSPIKKCCYFAFRHLNMANENVTFYIYLFILTVVSIACYYCIEIPAKNWIKGFKDRNRATSLVEDKVNF